MTRHRGHSHNVAERPAPVPTESTRPFWKAALEGKLRLPRCDRCGVLFYPPPPRCARCLSASLAWTTLSGRGRIFGITTVYLPTISGVTPPFTMVEVELLEQRNLILTVLLEAGKVAQPAIGDAATITFTLPGEHDFAYPQLNVVTRGGA